MKEPVDHILRPRLPWRPADTAPITECGYDATKVKLISREDYAKRKKDLGYQRAAMLTCMTCVNTADRWGCWDDDPRLAIGREVEWERQTLYRHASDKRGTRLKDELTVIAAMIEERRDEFLARVTEVEQRREWNQKKAARADKPKPTVVRSPGGL